MSTDYFDVAAQVSNIVANRSVKDALMTKLQTRRPPQRISVTDLTSLKQAYFRRKHPEVVPPLERQLQGHPKLKLTRSLNHQLLG